MSKNKCYISGKISGLPKEIYIQLFEQAKKEVIDAGFEPVSPIEIDHNGAVSWEDFMRNDIKQLMDCQAIYVLRNWRDSHGAKVEVELANILGFLVIHQSTAHLWAFSRSTALTTI